MYNVTYSGVQTVAVTITNFLFGPDNKPLCVGPCAVPLRWRWQTLSHRLVIVPHVLTCVGHLGRLCTGQCPAAIHFQGGVHFRVDWLRVSLLCLSLQLCFGALLIAMLLPCLKKCASRGREPVGLLL